MSKIVSTVAKPFAKIVTSAEVRVNGMEGALKKQIQHYNASGEDLTLAVWKEYVHWQRALLPYRRAKFFAEMRQLSSGKVASFATLDVKEALIGARVATKCVFLFLIFTILGRGTVFPLLEPTSPFVEQAILMQPNHRRHVNENLA